MRSPALAIAWELRQGHRWGVIALAAYALVVATIRLSSPAPWPPAELDPPNETAAVWLAPVSWTFMYFLAVFTFGLAGDLGARRSIYPARMFTLPVSTAALAGWPMLFGAVAMTGLWTATVICAVLPLGLDLPLIWPGLLAVVFLAWTQALTWMPYGRRGMRVIVAVLWLTALDAAVILAIHFEVSEVLMIALLAPQLPLAYLVARHALRRARCDDLPLWREQFVRLGPLSLLRSGRPERFASPTVAQSWIEWRRHGRRLPALVGLVLPFELALLFVPGDDASRLVWSTLVLVLLTPLLIASFATVKSNPPSSEPREPGAMTPFDATRPLTSAALAAAPMRTAIRSTLAAWLLVLLAVPLALIWSSTWPLVLEPTVRWVEAQPPLRAVATVLLVALGLLGLTWKQLAQNLSIELTGREWLVKATLFFALALLLAFGPLAGWVVSAYAMGLATGALAWIAAALVCLKLAAAARIATRLHRQRLLAGRTIMALAGGWLLAVLGLFGLFAWLVTSPFFPRRLLAAAVALAVPLARLAAAPLTVAANRHRRPSSSTALHSLGRLALRAPLVIGLPVLSILFASTCFHLVNRNNDEMLFAGRRREYLLHVPPNRDRSAPAPLVVSLHGGGGWPAYQRTVSRWNRLADEHGFLVVYPAGSGSPSAWKAEDGVAFPEDARFLAALIDRLEATHDVDPQRIYVDGLSNGASMAFVVSCTLSDRIAAVGMVAAAHSVPWSWCKDERPVPLIAFHGTADRLTPYLGGRSPAFPERVLLPSIRTWTASWARRNRCASGPVDSQVAGDVTRLEYFGCADAADVVLYTVRGGGHTWPGSEEIPEWLAGHTSNGVDATRTMWEFFRAHPLPSARRP